MMFEDLTLFIKTKFENDTTGHDFNHVLRVIKNAQIINEQEQQDPQEVYLCALLHDVYDEKFFDGDIQQDFNHLVNKFSLDINVDKMLHDLKNIGFKGGFEQPTLSRVGLIVQDADRLDAMGAIGIARTFAYGGHKGHVLYDPLLEYTPLEKKSDYRQMRSTLFHFYDKLLKLKDLMVTPKAQEIAEQRHQFMIDFLKQFYEDIS